MKILIVSATGMVGQSVLRECLLAADVEEVAVLVRSPMNRPPSSNSLLRLICLMPKKYYAPCRITMPIFTAWA